MVAFGRTTRSCPGSINPDPFAAIAIATGSSATPSMSIAGGAGVEHLNAMFTWTNDVNPTDGPTADAGQTEGWSAFHNAGTATGDLEFGGGYGDSTP